MAERTRENGDAGRFRRPRRGLRIIAAVALVAFGIAAVIVLVRRSPSRESLEEHIAAINARRALPPEENAATIYDQLIATKMLTGESPDVKLTPAALSGLIEASKVESCWFPLSPGQQCYMYHVRRLNPMREWTRALATAAREDIAGGRVVDADQKLLCLVRMGDHLQQQPLIVDFATGTGIEGQGWTLLGEFVMRPDASEELLAKAEAMPWELDSDYKEVSAAMSEAQSLIAKTVLAEWSMPQRMLNFWWGLGEKSTEQIIKEVHARLLSQRRGARLLLGLRRYHNTNGHWPDSLEEIRTLVPEQALIDPYTGQMLMYRKEADEFLLYSKGPNRHDDNGQHHEKADDYQIWLPRRTTSSQSTDREAP